MFNDKRINMASILRRSTLLRTALAAALLAAPPMRARNTNATWCFPSITWFGGTAPVIDGNISGDLGWRGAYVFTYDAATNGTPLHNVIVQGNTDGSNVYLSFEVHKPVAFSDNDVIMVAFDPDGTAPHQQLFEIYPVKIGEITQSNVAAQQVQYWVGSSTFSGPPVATPPAWVTNLITTNIRLSTSDGPTDFAYFLEMKVPIDATGVNGIPLPKTGAFGFYVNAIRVDDAATTEDQSYFPVSADPAGLSLTPPDASEWGSASFNGLCNGVSIQSITDSIVVTNPPPTTSSTGTTLTMGDGNTNTFNVVVQNSTVDAATGTPVLAPQIQPTFYIYNLGMPAPSEWTKVPTGNNPPPASDINPSASQSFSTAAWTIANSDPLYAFYQANPHQCIQVVLSANPPSTNPPTCSVASPPPQCNSAVITANGMVQNMNFETVTSGKMSRGFIGRIGTKGYVLPAGKNFQLVDLAIRTTAFQPNDSVTERDPRQRSGIVLGTGQNLLWSVHGYRHTGKYLKIGKITYETVAYIGGYGYGLTYSASNPSWRYQFFGENGNQIEPVGSSALVYRIRIPQGEAGFINATFEGDAAAGTGGPINGGGSGATGSIWKYWWLLLLIVLLLLFWVIKKITA